MEPQVVILKQRNERGWTYGRVGNRFFEAKVLDPGSDEGLDSGRVTRLAVCKTPEWNGHAIAFHYERGWGSSTKMLPQTTDDIRDLQAVLVALRDVA